jgi:HAD superfamily hydrolase (TIGR01509 family)
MLAVIFDLDGLLADTEPLWTESARRLLARRGLTYDAAIKVLTMGRHPVEVMGIYKAHFGLEGAPDALTAERFDLLRELYRTELRAMPGAVELVQALDAERVPMIVASSSPASLIQLVLERLGLRPPLERWLGSEHVQHGKPAPDLFLMAAAELGVEPRCCVVLEDSPAGLLAARAAGMRCVAVQDPASPAARHQPQPPADLEVESLRELTPARLRALINDKE